MRLEKYFEYKVVLAKDNSKLELHNFDSIRKVTIPKRSYTVKQHGETALVDIEFVYNGLKHQVIAYNRMTRTYKELYIQKGA